MKNTKWFLAALVVAVLFSALKIAGDNFSSRSLQSNVPGYSLPVDTNYSSFGCKSGGSWADTVWCKAYGYTYNTHVAEANKHSSVVVMFKRTGSVSGGFGLPNYGDYYVTGSYGSSAVGKNGQTYQAASVVKCSSGATMQYHSDSHHLYSPSLGEGFYDGAGHYWCDLSGVAVDPEKVDGRPSGIQLPDSDNVSLDRLYPVSFPGNVVKYKKIGDAGSFYKCTNGYEGPYEVGVNQYLNMYHIKESYKKNYYRCLTSDGSGFESAVSDGSMATFTASTGETNISASMFGLSDAVSCNSDYTTCQPSCTAGDSTCGGAGTFVTSGAFCASNTYIFQTSDYNTRYCAASLSTGTYTPPAPTFTLGDPTNVQLDSTYHAAGKTSFKTDEAIYFKAKRNITGTGIPSYPSVWMNVKVSNVSGSFSAPVWTGMFSGTTTSDSIGVAMPANTLTAGTYYFCAEMALNNNNNMVTSFSSANQKTSCVASSTVLTVTNACSGAQTWNGASCVNTCPSGMNWDAAKSMCVSSEQKEIIWNSLGLKSYVSIYAPQSVIDAAKAACANTKPGDAIWPNSGDFTKPETAGIPSCGTTPAPTTCGNNVCESSETSTSCPADCGGTRTTCDYDGVCESGETNATCSSDCYVAPPVPTTCKLGQTGCDVNLWCEQGSQCYVGGKLSCIDWNANCGGNLCAPKESSRYDAGCKEPGSITNGVDNNGDGKIDDFPGNCYSAMSCYSDDGKQRYCQPMDFSSMMGTAAVANHPTCSKAGFTNSCSPADTSCVPVGKRGTSGYCAPEGKQCHDDQGFLCVADGSECPSGSGVCPADSKNPESQYYGCTPDGDTSPDEDRGYCAVDFSVRFYSQDKEVRGIYCMKNPNPGDMNFWESATPPAGYGRCRYRDLDRWDSTTQKWEGTGCIDKLNTPQEKVSGRGYWCAVGMRQDVVVDGKSKVTCVSSKDYKPVVTPVEPIDKICPMVITPAYNTTTLECMTFSNGCLGEGWARLGVNQACENGKVVDFSNITNDKALVEVIDKKLSILENIRYRLKELPVNLSETGAIRELVEKATQAFTDLRAKLPAKTTAAKEEARAELERINKNLFAEIEAKWAKVQAHIDFATLRDEIYYRLPELKYEAGSCDQLSDYCKSLNELVPTLESFLKAAEGQTGQVFDQLMSDVRVTWEKIQTIMKEERGGHRDRFFESQVKQLMDVREGIRTFIDSHDIKDAKIIQVFEQFDALVTYLAQMVVTDNVEIIPIGIFPMGGVASSSYLADPKHILDKAFALKARLEGYLKVFSDYDVVYVTSLEELLPFVQDEVKRQLEELMPEIARTVKVLMDEALQELTLNMVAIVDELKPEIKEAVSQGLENLAIDLNEQRRAILDEVIAAKNEIVKRLGDLEALVSANLGSFNANQYRTRVIEVVAPVVWCGDYAALVESEINNAGLALENGEDVDIDELNTFVTDAMANNVQECRRVGASRFYMPIESWYWPYVEESAARGCINGYSANSGEPTGYFGEGDPTLRIEALKMVSCIFGVEQGDAVTDRSDVPAWGVPYFNGLKNAGVEFDWTLKMNEEISRFEIAELVVQTMLAVDKSDVISEAASADQILDFNDASSVKASKYALAVETLVDMGVLTGHSDGSFGGDDSTLRSEFAAILDRVNDLIVETYDIQGFVE